MNCLSLPMWPGSGVIAAMLLLPLGQVVAQQGPIDVQLINRDGQEVGTATLTQEDEGVRVRVQATELPPGTHGLHIHSRGACEPGNFESAGPHYQPQGRSHGFLDPQGPHSGDLPALTVEENGQANYDFTTTRISLDDSSLSNPQGTALVVHAQPDDYLTDTGGGSGDRIACGVISPANQQGQGGNR